jgi:uncharacterized protein (DUF2267 family)
MPSLVQARRVTPATPASCRTTFGKRDDERMKMKDPDIIARSVEKTHVWLNELAEELGTKDRQEAYRVLRAFLHALRDRLTIDEAAQLAAQLPDLIRGIYYEGWDPSATPRRYHDVDTFLGLIADEALLDGETRASYAAVAAGRVLRRHVSEGELRDVLAVLPEELRAVVAG